MTLASIPVITNRAATRLFQDIAASPPIQTVDRNSNVCLRQIEAGIKVSSRIFCSRGILDTDIPLGVQVALFLNWRNGWGISGNNLNTASAS